MTTTQHQLTNTLQIGVRLGGIITELDSGTYPEPETIAFLRTMLTELVAGADTLTAIAAGNDAYTTTLTEAAERQAAQAAAEAQRAQAAEARRAQLLSTVYNLACPDCQALPGGRCVNPRGTTRALEQPHTARTKAYRETEGKG